MPYIGHIGSKQNCIALALELYIVLHAAIRDAIPMLLQVVLVREGGFRKFELSWCFDLYPAGLWLLLVKFRMPNMNQFIIDLVF
jgi:hypothetical protein